MTENQRIWARARDRLASAVVSLGFPEEFAGLLAQQLKSPKAIDRMASYLYQAKPGSVEMIVDEMLAICADTEAWRDVEQISAGYYACAGVGADGVLTLSVQQGGKQP